MIRRILKIQAGRIFNANYMKEANMSATKIKDRTAGAIMGAHIDHHKLNASQ